MCSRKLKFLHVLNVFIEGSIFYCDNFVKWDMPVSKKTIQFKAQLVGLYQLDFPFSEKQKENKQELRKMICSEPKLLISITRKD